MFRPSGDTATCVAMPVPPPRGPPNDVFSGGAIVNCTGPAAGATSPARRSDDDRRGDQRQRRERARRLTPTAARVASVTPRAVAGTRLRLAHRRAVPQSERARRRCRAAAPSDPSSGSGVSSRRRRRGRRRWQGAASQAPSVRTDASVIGDVVALERPPAGQHLVEHARQTPRCRRACPPACPRACSGAM